MNRILMVIRYRKATHIGLRIFKIITINQFDKLDNLNNIWIFIEEDKCNERQQIKQSNVKQRRRYASSSNNNNKNITTSLVTSFLQYLRSELRATTNENNNDYQRIQEKKASETNNCLSQRFYLSNHFSRQQYPIQMSTSSSSSTASSQSLINNSKKLSNKNLLKNTFDNNSTNDDNEILTLINLLILRIECLPNDNTLITEKKNNEQSSKIKEIDQNLIEYLYYLFNKFINEDIDSNTPMVNKTNFVNICQTVVRSGSLNMPSTTSPDQSFSESTFTNDSDQTLIQTSVREYTADINDIAVNNSSLNEQISSASMNDQEAWLIVDLEEIKAERSTTNFDESKCLLSSPTCDDHLLPPNENYFSIEEIKSSESESSHSNYYSPDSSLDDLENMSHEIIEINNNNNNNILLKEEGSSSSSSSSSSNEHASNNTNVIIEVKDTTSNDNICTGLTNDCSTNNSSIDSKEQVASSIMETNEQMTMNLNDKTSRRERKMQERWTITTKNNKNTNEQLPTKAFLGVEFPPIAVLRRKFSSSPPSKLNTIPLKKKDYSTVKTKVLLNKNEINNSLQDNINKTNEHISSTPLNRSMSLQNQEINTSTTTNIVDKTKHDHQVLDLQSNDTSSLLICNDSKTNDDIQQSSTIISNLLTDEKILNENMKIETKQDLIEFDNEITTNINHNLDQHEQTNINNNNNSIMISDSIHTNSPPSSSSLLLMSSSSSSSLTTPTNEEKLIELLPNEIEEGKKEEEYFDGGDDNVHVEKKNNFNVEHNSYHTSGIIFINDEPTQAGLLEQEKKEKNEEEKEKEQPQLTLEQCNHQHFQGESSVKILSNNLEYNVNMSNIDNNEQLYKTIEIEEIPDEDDDLLKQNNYLIEPTDYILTDDELKISRQTSQKSHKSTTNDISFEFDPVLSCYEKAFSKMVENIDDSIKPSNTTSKESQVPLKTTCHQRPEDDPIALRALKRFEQRMNAAMATKIGNDETNPLMVKGKSSWSGTQSTPRKSLENVFKNDQTIPLTSTSINEQSPTKSSRDTFIRPRKTILDDIGINLGIKRNLPDSTIQNNSTNNDNHKIEEQEQQPQPQQTPIAIVENNEKQVVPDELIKTIVSEGHQQQEQEMIINLLTTNENSSSNEAENSNSLATSSLDSSLNTVISHSSSEQQTLTPYRLQLEGRRRLNTLERIHDRHDSNDSTQQFQNQYTVKPEELQDPIIRRALERFDEKSRSLAQTVKPSNFDNIQDPITRRALMRLETNLKRTMPSNPSTTLTSTNNNDPNETWYTNSYTLGSLQTNNDNRLTRYPDSSLSSTPSNKTPHVSIHQRFCSTSSSDMSELSTNNMISNNEHDIPIMRVPTQPIYVTSNNHQQQQQQQQQPISLRQRSHSEDMLSSRDISMDEITNLDNNNNNINQLQQDDLSDELQQQQQQQETPSSNEITSNKTDLPLPTTIIKSLDPNFVRTTEASINYVTPTQTYSAYSCEYTRPHQSSLLTSPKLELSSPRNYQQQNENDIQYSNPSSSSSSSAFTPVHPSTNNYHPQQPLPTPSYTSMYTPNNLNQTPYSDDPIVRRALERFNSQMQNSLMQMPQQQQNMNGMSRTIPNGYPRQGNLDSFYPNDLHPYDPWTNFNRSMPPTPNASTGYQSIIGRRRQLRHDDNYHDNTSVGNAYTSLLFVNSQNPYPQINNPYMNLPDEPPAIPPRLHRDVYREQQEYISENVNNNNNNNNNNAYIQQGYSTMPNGFRPISHTYMPSDSFHQFQDDEYLRHRAQSTSSTTSSDSVHPIHLTKQRLPPTFARTNIQQNKKLLPDDHSQLQSGQTTPNNGSIAGDSVFHRLAYTATKSSLSKSSSNLCANLLNKTPQQQQQQQQQQNKLNNLKPYEIDYDDTNNIPNKQESMSTSTNFTNKCQRSRSVDGRARLKNAQIRSSNNNNNNHHHINRSTNDSDDNNSTAAVPSSKFTSMNTRRDAAPPPRIPITPRSTISDRTPLSKRVSSGNNLSYTKNHNGNRTRNSNGNLVDTDNDENLTFNDNYQPKIIDNKTRASMPTHRYTANNNNNNNHIQSSASTSSVNSTMSRTKVPVPILTSLDKKDSNLSGTDLNRSSKRSDDNRLVSPTGQRRNIPVSVFSPAKHDNKRSTTVPSSSTSPTNDSNSINNCESQHEQQEQEQEQEQQISSSSRSSTGDGCYTIINNTNEMHNKLSTTNSSLKTSTGNILDELSLTNDKHDNTKKMNVFERLFRGHKKKV
ncbi:unnamed protein product [Rotaria sordida]|uniref:Uncharacterized protein n=1 Tax=Rotaria sordida TaxID=392033 RepID=A0A818V7F9_9BILA|nr:unnamed protein product [Rotaria sordida]